MVRKKETPKARGSAGEEKKIRIAKPVAAVAPVEEQVVHEKPKRIGRKRNAGKGVAVFGIVLILLGLGWFGAQAIMGQGGNVLAGLFGGGSELTGEEDGRVNFLLMGNPGDPSHDGPNLTDTIILASYDVEQGYLNMFSLPRDLWVNMPGYGNTKINAVYEIGRSDDGNGAAALRETVEQLVGLEIPYYMRVDFEGFEKIVDELGGVTVEVKKDLVDPYYPGPNDGYETLEIKAGPQTMDGDMALRYVRSRQTTSDFDRALRQQEVLVALRNKANDLELLTAPTKVFEINDILASHFETNLTRPEFERFLELLVDFDSTNVAFKVFDDSVAGLLYGTKVDAAYVLKPVNDDYSKIADFVASALTRAGNQPDQTAVPVEEPLKIEVLNGTNVTGLAGVVAEKLKAAGFEIVRVGNNATRGVTQSVVYDNTDGQKFSGVKRLSEILKGIISDEEITLGAGVDARVVVGTDAQNLQ